MIEGASEPTKPVDVRAEMLRAVHALSNSGESGRSRAVTSDLSIDEALLLHSIGWEPVDLVYGVSLASVPIGVWNWGQGEITAASYAHNLAFTTAAARLNEECAKVGGHGVVGVRVEVKVLRHHVDISLIGTAVRPVGVTATSSDVFLSDLSARDFSLLMTAGWRPVGLAFGASFVYAPRRSAGMALKQKTQNVELTNFTEATYSARESAMERMQRAAITLRGSGIVEVKVTEGPMSFARHAIGFAAWGTAVRLEASSHQYQQPQVVIPLDDAILQFEATSLRGP